MPCFNFFFVVVVVVFVVIVVDVVVVVVVVVVVIVAVAVVVVVVTVVVDIVVFVVIVIVVVDVVVGVVVKKNLFAIFCFHVAERRDFFFRSICRCAGCFKQVSNLQHYKNFLLRLRISINEKKLQKKELCTL